MHQSTTQLELPGKLRVRFDIDPLTSDAGLPLVASFDAKLSMTERLARLLPDDRNPLFVTHTALDLLRQRVYGIVAGYEDGNDAAHLRSDPALKVACRRRLGDSKSDLASQPTLSRFESRIDRKTLYRLHDALFQDWIDRREPPKGRLVLDFDSTWNETHGAQQLTFFNGHYDAYGYHPLLVHDVETGEQILAILRPGNVGAASGALSILKRMVRRIREKWPTVTLVIRADAGFSSPELYDWCDNNDVHYLIGLINNVALTRKSAASLGAAKTSYFGWMKKVGGVGRTFTEFQHRAKTWRRDRRVIAMTEFGALGPNQRYVITSFKGRLPRQVYAYYCRRGQMENGIKDFKNALKGDRLSCSSFKMNAFRMVMHTIAYRLCRAMTAALKGTVGATWQFDTLRLKLLKVAGHVVQQARQTVLRLPSRYPYQLLWRQLANHLAPPPLAA